MRLPNGYGTVYKLSGNRRKPWIARKTKGWSDDGKQEYETIGYYAKREDALKALADYNATPYDLNSNKLTFADVYVKWSARKFANIVAPAGYSLAYKLSHSLHGLKFADIKTDDLQGIIDTCGKGYATRKVIKTLYNQMWDYGMERDIVGKNYAEYVDIGKNDKDSIRKPFTKKEIDKLWKLKDSPKVDLVLIMIYSGWRPGELVTLKTEDIDLTEKTMRGGIKTAAGKNRIVPINEKILPLIEKRYDPANEFLVTGDRGTGISYSRFLRMFDALMENLGMTHKPHDCRHTFATLMNNAEANKVSIKRIMGHAQADVTEGYTHKDIKELRKAINLI